jgi:predicted transcriptional regulator
MTIRLSKIQRLHLEKLAAKFQIDQSNVIRIAIARLAEQEGIVNPEKGRPR